MKLLGVILTVLAVLIAWKVGGNFLAIRHPPVSCQLLGGHWSVWDGWVCGGGG